MTQAKISILGTAGLGRTDMASNGQATSKGRRGTINAHLLVPWPGTQKSGDILESMLSTGGFHKEPILHIRLGALASEAARH